MSRFAEKYGKPESVSHQDLQTLMGVRATNEIQQWKGEKVSVQLFCYSNEITKGMASIETNAHAGARSRKADAKKKKAKDSL